MGPKVIVSMLVSNDVALSDYVGNTIMPLGKVKFMVMYKDRTMGIWVYVISNGDRFTDIVKS